MAATKEHLENLIKEGGPSEEDNAAFEAAFGDEHAEPSTEAIKQTVVDTEEEPAPADKSTVADKAPAADATAQPAKQEPDRIAAMEERMNKWMRDNGGVIGNVKDQIERMSRSAKASASAQGASSPTKEQVEAAAKDAQAWDKLKKEYPEWGGAIESQMGVMEQRILQKVPRVDADAIKNDAVKGASESAQSAVGQLKAALPLYIKHPDWEETINKPEFLTHALTGGPTAEEYMQYKQLESSEPAKAGEALNELIRKHPNWWSEKGSKLFSDSITDAIALMDSFTEAAKAAANPAPADKSRQQANKARLESAVTPTSGATRVKQTKSDHQEFEEAFGS